MLLALKPQLDVIAGYKGPLKNRASERCRAARLRVLSFKIERYSFADNFIDACMETGIQTFVCH